MTDNKTLPSKLDDKYQAEILCQLYKAQLDRFKHTRDIWFKIMLTLWTFIIIAGYYINKEIHLHSLFDYYKFICIYIIVGGAIWFIYYNSYRKNLEDSQVIDKDIGIQYRKKLNELLGITLEDEKDPKTKNLDNPYPKENRKWENAELLITLFLYLIAGIYIII